MSININSLIVKNEVGNGIPCTNFKQKVKEQENIESNRSSIKNFVKNILDPTTGMSDEKRESFENRIDKKIKDGKKLTADELRYIQMNNPEMYTFISRVQAQRDNLEKQLKNCQSKEEVNKVCTDSMTRISKNDPAKEALVAAYQDVEKEFKESDEYQKLPQIVEKKDKDENIIYDKVKVKTERLLEEVYLEQINMDISFVNFNG